MTLIPPGLCGVSPPFPARFFSPAWNIFDCFLNTALRINHHRSVPQAGCAALPQHLLGAMKG